MKLYRKGTLKSLKRVVKRRIAEWAKHRPAAARRASRKTRQPLQDSSWFWRLLLYASVCLYLQFSTATSMNAAAAATSAWLFGVIVLLRCNRIASAYDQGFLIFPFDIFPIPLVDAAAFLKSWAKKGWWLSGVDTAMVGCVIALRFHVPWQLILIAVVLAPLAELSLSLLMFYWLPKHWGWIGRTWGILGVVGLVGQENKNVYSFICHIILISPFGWIFRPLAHPEEYLVAGFSFGGVAALIWLAAKTWPYLYSAYLNRGETVAEEDSYVQKPSHIYTTAALSETGNLPDANLREQIEPNIRARAPLGPTDRFIRRLFSQRERRLTELLFPPDFYHSQWKPAIILYGICGILLPVLKDFPNPIPSGLLLLAVLIRTMQCAITPAGCLFDSFSACGRQAPVHSLLPMSPSGALWLKIKSSSVRFLMDFPLLWLASMEAAVFAFKAPPFAGGHIVAWSLVCLGINLIIIFSTITALGQVRIWFGLSGFLYVLIVTFMTLFCIVAIFGLIGLTVATASRSGHYESSGLLTIAFFITGIFLVSCLHVLVAGFYLDRCKFDLLQPRNGSID